jgi:Protein of unknown function (DUF1592)/Protein of unknown function (DUF1588)/Protein of unknown function (DUF1595)/Protein of unknown function (DUF1587)/Protein of unknown function (DUF1585)
LSPGCPRGIRKYAAKTLLSPWLAPALLASLTACSGKIGDVPASGSLAGGTAGSSAGAGPGAVAQPVSVLVATPRIARLSQSQWANTVRDLLKLPDLGGVEAQLTKDAVVNFDNEAEALRVADDLRADLQRVSEQLADKVALDPAALARIVPSNAPSALADKARAFITTFGLRAYRRPLSASEVDEAMGLFNQGPTLFPGTDPFAAGVELLLPFFLQSPHFLYRIELSTAVIDGKIPLNSYEIASKVSYALANTMPDDALFELASRGGMVTSDDVMSEATRLLGSPKGVANLEHFHFQMLKLGGYAGITKDAAAFPKFTTGAPGAMSQETTRFLDWIFSENLGVKEMFMKPVTFVNASLAPIYGLSGQFTNDFTKVDLDPTQRAGILTQLGFLSLNAHELEIDSIHRGVFVIQRILCTQLSPPANVTITPVPLPDAMTTNRERVWAHTGPGTCGAACHGTIIDPVGFAFENFDAVGAYRTTDNGQPVDASGTFPFGENDAAAPKSYKNAVEFSSVLAKSSQAHQCYSQDWMSYLFARSVDPEGMDAPIVGYLAQRSLGSGLSIKDLVMTLVSTDNFIARLPGGP